MSFKNLKVERVEGELAAALTNWYPFDKRGFIKVGQKKWFLPYRYAEDGGAIYEFEIRPDDTWIVTYPRSGTTMTQELIWLVANNMNFDEAHRKYLIERFPFIDLGVMLDEHIAGEDVPGRINMDKNTAEFVRNQPSPRFIKSHMPFELLPTVVNSTCKRFKSLILRNSPASCSPYWEHVKEAWAMKHRENMMFLFYEDLIKDLPGNIKKIATFFNKFYSDEQIAKLTEHLKVENFRKNPMVNQPTSSNVIRPEMFIRQGMTGRWKEMFTPEIEERFNKWITDNLKDTDLTFPS